MSTVTNLENRLL